MLLNLAQVMPFFMLLIEPDDSVGNTSDTVCLQKFKSPVSDSTAALPSRNSPNSSLFLSTLALLPTLLSSCSQEISPSGEITTSSINMKCRGISRARPPGNAPKGRCISAVLVLVQQHNGVSRLESGFPCVWLVEENVA